ncbi:MAG: sulfurtransferase-like selenium metabolism protein YedF [Nitrospirae bacterium]|nr:sulfurtransferase-like selenium metabolism protein YedF [Nitrospirota bacterium]
MIIDAKGVGCPKPVMLAEEALSGMDAGIVEILVDNEGSAGNLEWFAKRRGFFSETVKEPDQWRVKIVKGYDGRTDSADKRLEERQETDKSLMLIVGSDTLGKEELLGKMLVKGFFETMKVTREIPHTIFFLNAGVKLTTINEEIIPVLKDLAEMGVEIFSCGTCLKYYDLESELKVGYRGTTNHIVEGMTDFNKVVWI